jgi:hypothetical protein
VWAHNLAYDLRISRALELLPRLGYSLTGIVLNQTAVWASFKGPAGALLCCDLSSWASTTLERIARDLGIVMDRVDIAELTEARLESRCVADVNVTAQAVAELLEYVRKERLGPFRPTGAGQAHACWRRRFMTDAVHVHDDTVALAWERRAMWTGRCEAWRWGVLNAGPYTEYDFNLAYCRHAAAESVPVELVDERAGLTAAGYQQARRRGAVLALVEVETDLPLVPAEDGDRIHWPTGRFSTVLWSPEIDLLLTSGAKVTINHAWLYRQRPALAPMARWLIEQLELPEALLHPLVRRMLKHWSRAMVGRMALRYRSWDHYGTVAEPGLGLEIFLDLEAREQTQMLCVGHDQFVLSDLEESETSTPMVVGWIMARARVDLWRVMHYAGLANVVYVDTDSILVNARGYASIDAFQAVGYWPTLGVKGTYRQATIYGPRQLDLDSDARFSGVPKRSVRRGPLTFESEQWTGLQQSIASGAAGEVVVKRGPVVLSGHDPRREHLRGGATAAHRIGEP